MTTQRPRAVRLYESTLPSGNAHKVSLLLAHLGLRVPVTELDILAQPSETRTSEYLAKNPNGRVPLLELEDGSYLAESNAILFYLAEGTPFLSDVPLERARTLQWMFFEQYSHEPYVAVLKFWTYWGGLHNKRADEIALWKTRGQAALEVMDKHLQGAAWFSGPLFGIADIALYAYSNGADAVGFDFGKLAALRNWLERVRAQPGHIAQKPDPLGKAPALL
jgi:glutathione S-transferase